MIVGIPTEIMPGERRVAATPETIRAMIAAGYELVVQAGAGLGALIDDAAYQEAGARLVADARTLYQHADIILKVKEPRYNSDTACSELDLMHEGQVVIAFLHPAAPANHDMVRQMAQKGITGLTLDGVPRISRAQSMDALTSMSTCAGYKGMLMAAEGLGSFVPQLFTAVGMIQPARVLVIGAGVAGLQAIATAKRLGALVFAADIRPDAAEQARSLGAKTVDLGIPADLAVGDGGYAQRLSTAWLAKEREALAAALPDFDIVFCSALVPSQKAPILITEDMVSTMKNGSVLVDVSIDQGGNCAITRAGQITVSEGVTIQGIQNIPGLLPVSSTWLFAKNVTQLLHHLTLDRTFHLDRSDEITASILTTIDGTIVHQAALDAMAEN